MLTHHTQPRVQWVHLHPRQGEEKQFLGVISRANLYVHFQAEQESDILCWTEEIFRVGVVHLVVLACVLRATTKKVVNFLMENALPEKKILATPM